MENKAKMTENSIQDEDMKNISKGTGNLEDVFPEMENLISGPLKAAVDAQEQSTESAKKFIEDVEYGVLDNK